jgi:uncharacterized protein (DUF2237 family)
MPPTYQVTEAPSIPRELFGADGTAVVVVSGSRHADGSWHINAASMAFKALGSIRTGPDTSPGAAVDTVCAWVTDICARNGLEVKRMHVDLSARAWKDLNDQPGQSQCLCLARFTIAKK